MISGSGAEILLFDEKTSRHYFERYQKGGLQVLLDDNYSGVEPKLDEHQMSELEGYLEEHILPDAKSIIAYIDKHYGVRYSISISHFPLLAPKRRLFINLRRWIQ